MIRLLPSKALPPSFCAPLHEQSSSFSLSQISSSTSFASSFSSLLTSRFFTTASNKKWYVRNKRWKAEEYYITHILRPQVGVKLINLSHRYNSHVHTNPQRTYIANPTASILNPFTTVLLRPISYVSILGQKEGSSSSSKWNKKGFQTAYDDTESHRNDEKSQPNNTHETVSENEHPSKFVNRDNLHFDSKINSLREQERLMEMDLSTSAIRNTHPVTLESHHHLLHSDVLPFPHLKSSSHIANSATYNNAFHSSIFVRSFTGFNSMPPNNPSTSDNPTNFADETKDEHMSRVTQKLENLTHEKDIMRNRLQEKSFDSVDALSVEDEEKLTKLDESASEARNELKEENISDSTVPEENLGKFQARAYDDLETEGNSQTSVDDDGGEINPIFRNS